MPGEQWRYQGPECKRKIFQIFQLGMYVINIFRRLIAFHMNDVLKLNWRNTRNSWLLIIRYFILFFFEFSYNVIFDFQESQKTVVTCLVALDKISGDEEIKCPDHDKCLISQCLHHTNSKIPCIFKEIEMKSRPFGKIRTGVVSRHMKFKLNKFLYRTKLHFRIGLRIQMNQMWWRNWTRMTFMQTFQIFATSQRSLWNSM